MSRRTTAYHEAAHTVAAILHGRKVALVSIRAGEGYSGITIMMDATLPDLPRAYEPAMSLLLRPRDWRADMEAEIVADPAGPIAGRIAEFETGYVEPDPCEGSARRVASALAVLSPRHRELLDSHEAEQPEHFRTDEQTTEMLSGAIVGQPNEASAHLYWLGIVAENFVTTHWPQIEALAQSLLVHEVRTARRPRPSSTRAACGTRTMNS